jgi:hypothetical protein
MTPDNQHVQACVLNIRRIPTVISFLRILCVCPAAKHNKKAVLPIYSNIQCILFYLWINSTSEYLVESYTPGVSDMGVVKYTPICCVLGYILSCIF